MATKPAPKPHPKPDNDGEPLGDTPAVPATLISLGDLMASGQDALKAKTPESLAASLDLFDRYTAIAGSLPKGLAKVKADVVAAQRDLK